MSKPFTEAGGIPVDDAVPFTRHGPVVLDVPGRHVPLQLDVSAPATGDDLPVILFAHGHGASNFLASRRGYGPLVDFWAAHGFVVVQPTHLDANEYDLRGEDLPDAPLFWHDRAEDMHVVLDRLDEIAARVPGLSGRLDLDRIATVGHSLGGSTVTSLMGMRMMNPADDREKDLSDPRIKVGVAFAPPGVGDEHMASWARENYPALQYPDFSTMTGATLVVAGDQDLNPNFSDRLSYRWDAYTRSPGGNKTLLTVFGAGHMFGGISGYDAGETSDENPERVATLRALVWAYLRTNLYPEDVAWKSAVAALEAGPEPLAAVETK